MLTPHQLDQIAGAATALRVPLEAAILTAPSGAATMIAFARLSPAERASQTDLTAASAHLASAAALLHRVADRVAPVIEATAI